MTPDEEQNFINKIRLVIKEELDTWTPKFVPMEVYTIVIQSHEERFSKLEDRVSKAEDNFKKAAWLIVTLVMTALIGTIFANNKVGVG